MLERQPSDGRAEKVASPTDADGDWKALEDEVFDWLLGQPAVAAAVDLACSGSWEEAVTAFDAELQQILAKAPEQGAGQKTVVHTESTGKCDSTDKQPLAAGLRAAEATRDEPVTLEVGNADDAPTEPSSVWLDTDTQAASAKRSRQEDMHEAAPLAKRSSREDLWLAKSRERLEEEAVRAAHRSESSSSLPTGADTAGKVVPLYWEVDLPEVSKLVAKRGKLLPSHTPVEQPHVTLLYLGGATDEAQAVAASGLPLQQFQSMKAALVALQDKVVEVWLTEVVIEENVTCAKVALPADVPCANEVAHVTLGTKAGVPARYANQVLEEVKKGRKEGVTTVPLPSPRPLKGRVQLHTAPVGSAA